MGGVTDDAFEHEQDIGTDVFVNGVDIATGRYAQSPLAPALVAKIADGRPLSAEELDSLQERVQLSKEHLGLTARLNADNLRDAGWGVVFAKDDPNADAYREALSPLLRKRAAEAGEHYKEFIHDTGALAGENGAKFLSRHGSAPGPVNPGNGVPYYLLLVASPKLVPFEAQTEMSLWHAVGRLEMKSVDALASYTNRLVQRETDAKPLPKRAAFYATRNNGDLSTQRSVRLLAKPLAERLGKANPDWTIDRRIADEATKKDLERLLHADVPPSLLFTASHGARMPIVDAAAQKQKQGALITQEWPGPMNSDRALTENELFSADEVSDTARLDGMITFLFACYSAGTPLYDEFFPEQSGARRTIASEPFVARLPQRLLECGAAAVIGHVERAWGWSFRWPQVGQSIETFASVVDSIANGMRIGAAFDYLSVRYGQVAALLANQLRLRRNHVQNDEEVAGLWVAQTDARNYVILGDPAVRLTTAASMTH